jgi:hypothetical protein
VRLVASEGKGGRYATARPFSLFILFIATWAPATAGEDLVKPEKNKIPVLLSPKSIKTQITEIRTGWNDEQFGIVTVAPIVTTPCPTHDGYVTDHDDPGYHTYYAAALLAFAERATVIVVVSSTGCVAGRPQLIGLDIVR